MNCKTAMGERYMIGLMLLLVSFDISGQFGGGTGTKENPYLIINQTHLSNIKNYLNTPDIYFLQVSDIDLKSAGNWVPIGGFDSKGISNQDKFSGHYNGNGYRILNLTIEAPEMNNVGLFGHIGPSETNPGKPVSLKNIRLVNVFVKGARGVGSLVGRVTGNANTLIEGCSVVNGTVTGDAATGGLVGSNNSKNQTPGGIDNPVIRRCYSNVDVYFSGNGNENIKFGGLVGCSQKGDIVDSYAHGKVIIYQYKESRVEKIGGLAGCIEFMGKIVNSYSTGWVYVNGNVSKVGGLVGNTAGYDSYSNGCVINSFWNVETSGQKLSAGGKGLTSFEMRQKNSFAEWDFDNTWKIERNIENGFPYIDYSLKGFNTYYSPELEKISGWRMISSPVSTYYLDLLGGFFSQGVDGAAYPEEHANLYWFDESDPNSSTMGWKSILKMADKVVPGKGFFFYMYGYKPTDKRYFLDLPDKVSATGKDFFNGEYFEFNEFTFPLTYTPREIKYFLDEKQEGYYDISIMEAGWNLLGNPTGQTLDWDAEGWQKVNIDNTIYIWDPVQNEYKFWNGTIGNLYNGQIPPFQAFWVKANRQKPFLSFDKRVIINDSPKAQNIKTQIPSIKIEVSNGNDLKSTAFISMGNLASPDLDEDDAFRLEPLSNSWLSVYTTPALNKKLPMVINNIPFPEENKTELPLYVKGRKNGNPITGRITLSWNIQDSWPNGYGLVLYDHLNRKAVSMLHQKEYQFLMPTESLIEVKFLQSFGSDSFNGTFILPVDPDLNLKSTGTNNPFSIVIFKGFVDPHPRYNMMKNALIDIFPNPVKTSTTIRFSISKLSKVTLELYNMKGILEEKITERQFVEGIHSISWQNSGLVPGMYVLKLTSDNFTSSQRILISK